MPISMDQGADRRQQPTIAVARLMDAAQVGGAVNIQRMRVCLYDGEGFLIRLVVAVLTCGAGRPAIHTPRCASSSR